MIVGAVFTVTTALPVISAAIAVQLASDKVAIVYVVDVVGDTLTVIGLVEPLKDEPLDNVPLHGPVPVKAILKEAELPLQIVVVPLITPVGRGLTIICAVASPKAVVVTLPQPFVIDTKL